MISPRHEAVAAHMAGAYARLTGRLGVCIASNGPGVANMLPGVAVENGEGNRVLLLTSSRRTGISYPDRGGAYQCFDHVAVIRGMSKWSETVHEFARIPELMRQALRACFTGRPGVVHLDVPENLINGVGPEPALGPPASYRRTAPLEPRAADVEAAAELLEGARLPVIHAGSGVIHAQAFAELARLAELLHAPVDTSWSARGVLPETSPLAWPMIHIEACNRLRNEADVILCLGSQLGETDWWGKPPYWAPPAKQKLVQVDVDDARLGRNRPADLAILADAKCFLLALLARLEGRGSARSLAERRRKVGGARGRPGREPREARRAARESRRADAHGARPRQLPPRLRRRRGDGASTAATPPSGGTSSARFACPTPSSRRPTSAISAPAWGRRSAPPSPTRGVRSIA